MTEQFPRGTILVVDDQVAIRTFLEFLLPEEGFQVVSCQDGTAALHQLAKARPALVLCDINMPLMNGWEVLAQVRHQPQWATVPVILMTVADEPPERLHSLDRYTRLLTKPFTIPTLLTQIDSLIGRA